MDVTSWPEFLEEHPELGEIPWSEVPPFGWATVAVAPAGESEADLLEHGWLCPDCSSPGRDVRHLVAATWQEGRPTNLLTACPLVKQSIALYGGKAS